MVIKTETMRFGVEIEINAFDDINTNRFPTGIEYVAKLVRDVTLDSVRIDKHGFNHDLSIWTVKKDGSCGMEICSPVMKGDLGIQSVEKVIEKLGKDEFIRADKTCSFHVHVNISELTHEQLASVLAYWIKCEPVFLDSMPVHRKNNRYCQVIGFDDAFKVNMLASDIVKELGVKKYTTINTYHYCSGSRKSMEFRLADEKLCISPNCAKNWIILLLHFINTTKNLSLPNLSWLDPVDVFDLLFKDMDLALYEARGWFLKRLKTNVVTYLPGFWSKKARRVSIEQIKQLSNDLFY